VNAAPKSSVYQPALSAASPLPVNQPPLSATPTQAAYQPLLGAASSLPAHEPALRPAPQPSVYQPALASAVPSAPAPRARPSVAQLIEQNFSAGVTRKERHAASSAIMNCLNYISYSEASAGDAELAKDKDKEITRFKEKFGSRLPAGVDIADPKNQEFFKDLAVALMRTPTSNEEQIATMYNSYATRGLVD
jgi:hypothetical protein